MKGKGPNWSVSGPSAGGAGAGTNETENSGEKVGAAAGRQRAAVGAAAALVPPARMQDTARMLHQYSSNPALFSSNIKSKL